ncbi:DUF3261 domain-containing protein [Simiduia aestuariiviva]|uniref:DUF3261 domain-containing protein n=1 Tax=Simiduia aestuariiviva TaxID=1510459 RepID=A0A839UV54_9GAMM|nr:DUF3261 domain-containing protein [Simiduia aestuariiviva]MBB3169247.1 hypothetical protein [Simiduia aestuariiviva]
MQAVWRKHVCLLFLQAWVAAIVAGCAALPSPVEQPPLLAPALLGQNLQVIQRVALDYEGQRRNLMVVWTQQAGQLSVLGLTAQGRKIFSLSYDGDTLHTERFLPVPASLSDARFMRELQWAYWPAEAVLASLVPVGWSLTVVDGRRLFTDPSGREMEYRFTTNNFPASLELTHFQGYRMNIETLSVQPLNAAIADENHAEEKRND